MSIETIIECRKWQNTDFDALAQRAVLAVLSSEGLPDDSCELVVLATDDAHIADLNQSHRDKSGATNVLSWPSQVLDAPEPGGMPSKPQQDAFGEIALGDIAISYETCTREALEVGKTLADHTTHLVVHGTLHLLGYDHVRDEDATLMERREVEILGTLGVDDPYREIDGV